MQDQPIITCTCKTCTNMLFDVDVASRYKDKLALVLPVGHATSPNGSSTQATDNGVLDKNGNITLNTLTEASLCKRPLTQQRTSESPELHFHSLPCLKSTCQECGLHRVGLKVAPSFSDETVRHKTLLAWHRFLFVVISALATNKSHLRRWSDGGNLEWRY